MTLESLPTSADSALDSPWLQMPDAGQASWWQKLAACGTPILKQFADGDCLVSFIWQDPEGDEQYSSIRQVLLDINSVTDHHSWTPATLQRLPGTDIWFASMKLETSWRGSYSFIPLRDDQIPTAEQQRGTPQQQRQWWISVAVNAVADKLNPNRSYAGGWGTVSALHLADALPQPAWKIIDKRKNETLQINDIDRISWSSPALQRDRTVWIHNTAHSPAVIDLPLILLLDGDRWANTMPVFSVLTQLTGQGQLPPALYLLIDAINGDIRSEELPCNETFWQAIQQELLPLVRQAYDFTDRADKTVIVGQSFGGLAALYAGLNWPQCFGNIVTQSGSFWWPNSDLIRNEGSVAINKADAIGQLTEQVRSGLGSSQPLRIFQEVGKREGLMNELNENMRDALMSAGHEVHYRQYNGGHDVLCWRGGLIDGIQWALNRR